MYSLTRGQLIDTVANIFVKHIAMVNGSQLLIYRSAVIVTPMDFSTTTENSAYCSRSRHGARFFVSILIIVFIIIITTVIIVSGRL